MPSDMSERKLWKKRSGLGLLGPGPGLGLCECLRGRNFGALRSTPGLGSLVTDPVVTEEDFGDAAVRLEGLG